LINVLQGKKHAAGFMGKNLVQRSNEERFGWETTCLELKRGVSDSDNNDNSTSLP